MSYEALMRQVRPQDYDPEHPINKKVQAVAEFKKLHAFDPPYVVLGLDPSNGGDGFGISLVAGWGTGVKELLNGDKANLGWDQMTGVIADWYAGMAAEFPGARLFITLDGTASHGLSLQQVERIVNATQHKTRTRVLAVTMNGTPDQGKGITAIPGTSPTRYSLSRNQLVNETFQDFTQGSVGIRALSKESREMLKAEMKGLKMKRNKMVHGKDGDDFLYSAGLGSATLDKIMVQTGVYGSTARALREMQAQSTAMKPSEKRDFYMKSRGL